MASRAALRAKRAALRYGANIATPPSGCRYALSPSKIACP